MDAVLETLLHRVPYVVLFAKWSMDGPTFYGLIAIAAAAFVGSAAALSHWRRRHTRFALIVCTQVVCIAAMLNSAWRFGLMSDSATEYAYLVFVLSVCFLAALSFTFDMCAWWYGRWASRHEFDSEPISSAEIRS
jgi:uncharacterized membrane protein YfcA